MAIKQNLPYIKSKRQSSLQRVSEEYWMIVDKILYDFMQIDSSVIGDKIVKLKQSVENAPKQEQLLFYHQNPLNLIIDLTGLEPNEEAMRQYRALVLEYPK